MADELDDLASFFDEEKQEEANSSEESADDFLASFFDDETPEESADEDDGDLLSSFFDDDEEDEADNNDLLTSFFGSDPEEEETALPEAELETTPEETEEDGLLSSFFSDKATDDTAASAEDDDEDDEDAGIGEIFGNLIGSSSQKPEPLFPYKKEKRKARLDITKSSKDDHRNIKRYTKHELNDQIKRDYKYMLSKPYMIIQPITILADYPYKKKKSDDDEIRSYNTAYDYALVIGKLLKWRSIKEFKRKPYKLGEIMYVKRGIYWVNGKEMDMEPHFAIVLHRSYKRIKSKRIRDMLAPLKQRLRSGKPFTIYKEFPIIIKRTGAYS